MMPFPGCGPIHTMSGVVHNSSSSTLISRCRYTNPIGSRPRNPAVAHFQFWPFFKMVGWLDAQPPPSFGSAIGLGTREGGSQVCATCGLFAACLGRNEELLWMPEPHGADVGKGGVCCSRRFDGGQQHGEHSRCNHCGEIDR